MDIKKLGKKVIDCTLFGVAVSLETISNVSKTGAELVRGEKKLSVISTGKKAVSTGEGLVQMPAEETK
jgi:hypothetical protein